MKKLINYLLPLLFVVTFIYSCNNAEVKTTVADTPQTIPGINDSIPGVVNPGQGNTDGVIKTPVPNDNNVILPDSAH